MGTHRGILIYGYLRHLIATMSIHSEKRFQSLLESHKCIFLWILCIFAMLRIFFFSAVFPFFNNVDEQAHFDTVVKYSKGYLPRNGTADYEYESAKSIVLYGSPEYFHTPQDYKSGKMPLPVWSIYQSQQSSLKNELDKLIYKEITKWTRSNNHEAFSPPVYYVLAGAWYDLLKVLGLKGGDLLYGIRFLNILLYGILFWITYLFCKNTLQNDLSMQFGILLLLSFFPQAVFYSVNSDVLSPLLFIGSLYLLIQISNSNRSSLFHLIAGLSVSLTFLTKLTNLPILIFFSIFILIRVKNLLNEERLKAQLLNILLLVSGCCLPIACWLGWNFFVLGDMTGDAMKLHQLEMKVKPLAAMWDHPIFTLKGLIYFISESVKNFWRGELIWGLQRIASNVADYFYVISSCIFVPVSIISNLASKENYSPQRRFLNLVNALVLVFFALVISLLSMMFDFGTCWFPSQKNPFFTNTRIILGAFVPFLILYLDGIRIIITKISTRINYVMIILLICILIFLSEIYSTYPVMGSNYNWFHMH